MHGASPHAFNIIALKAILVNNNLKGYNYIAWGDPPTASAFLSLLTIVSTFRYRVPSLRALSFSTPLHGDRSVPLYEIGQSTQVIG